MAIQIPFYDKKIAKTTCRGNDMTFFIVFKQGFEEIASHFDIANKYKMHFLRLKSSNHLLYGTEHSFEFSMFKKHSIFFLKELFQNFILRSTQINKS